VPQELHAAAVGQQQCEQHQLLLREAPSDSASCLLLCSNCGASALKARCCIPCVLACRILDTRKTAPGLRLLDKWAVALGGGTPHRMGLYDMMMIKDNHIAAAGGIGCGDCRQCTISLHFRQCIMMMIKDRLIRRTRWDHRHA
jgi:hypothetical protein